MNNDLLFDLGNWWDNAWKDACTYDNRDLSPIRSIKVNFARQEDIAAFEAAIGQSIGTKTRSVWYPQASIGTLRDKQIFANKRYPIAYPIYIISKGRWESRLTAKSLERMNVPYRIVVEPQEFDAYARVIESSKILVLPFSNLGQGSIPARNWVWEHSISEGHKKHWILDDNIDGFYVFQNNLKCPIFDGTSFAAAERFTDRFENVALSGMNYFMFVKRKYSVPPIVLNTRIYSCILINNSGQHRWRGRYNEDTDLSLRYLKDGQCTILFNAFLCGKAPTMTMRGGNTDALYGGDGRRLMAESLRDQHPDVVKVITKWGRFQHHVDYRPFKKNKLIERPDAPPLDIAWAISDRLSSSVNAKDTA